MSRPATLEELQAIEHEAQQSQRLDAPMSFEPIERTMARMVFEARADAAKGRRVLAALDEYSQVGLGRWRVWGGLVRRPRQAFRGGTRREVMNEQEALSLGHEILRLLRSCGFHNAKRTHPWLVVPANPPILAIRMNGRASRSYDVIMEGEDVFTVVNHRWGGGNLRFMSGRRCRGIPALLNELCSRAVRHNPEFDPGHKAGADEPF